MNKAKFFAALRAPLFNGAFTSDQVAGIDAILDEAEHRKTPRDRLAYMLATTYHETAATMEPIFERGPRAYFNKYEPTTKIGRELGNTVTGDGYRFRGRGYVQLTGRRNYRKASEELGFDIVASPQRALELGVAASIMFLGMTEGWFTGRKLDDYIKGDKCDYVNARRIINGTDKAQKIAGYAEAFAKALRAAGYVGQAPAKPITIPPAPVAPPAPVVPVPAPVVVPEPVKKPGLVGWIKGWF